MHNTITTIDLLRHGKVEGGVCYRGSRDDPLSDEGWQQMVRATKNIQWDLVVTSPLKRCAMFAEKLSTQTQIMSNFREINFGDWEGKTYAQLKTEQPANLNKFICDPENNTPPNAEPLIDFRQRTIKEWNNLINLHKGKHILLISHGGTMRCIMSHVLNIPVSHMMRLEVKHASLSQVKVYDDEFSSLIFHGKII